MNPNIGGYEIQGELGRGGMGVVYQAYDRAIGRAVAIKVIRVDPGTTPEAGAELRQRLVREANVAGNIYHPCIVTVHQLGEDGENVFVVMEFVDGSSLEKLLSNNPQLDRAWAIGILRQVADALDYAHKSNVVHRDVKPANILVRADGRVKVVDFGIAMIQTTVASGLTGTGVSLGSPAYMSPEQIQAAQIDGRSDQFALGTMAFQMLTGRMPFKGDTAHSVMYQIVTADPFAPQPLNVQPGDKPLEPAVRLALGKALAKNPHDRFPDCVSFIQALGAAVGVGAGDSVAQTSTARMDAVLRDVAPLPEPVKVESKNWLPYAVLGGLLTLLLIGGGVFWYMRRAAILSAANQAPGQKPLIKAIVDGPPEAVNKYLTAQSVNDANPDGTTPLLAAIGYGKIDVVKMLLAKGAKVDAPGRDGTTPLMLASEGTAYLANNLPLVEILLAANASVDTQDLRGRTALHRAVAEGKIEVVRLLLDDKAPIDTRANDGATPLFYAVSYGKMQILQLLLEKHAQVDLTDSAGNTPLMVASEGTAYLPNNGPMVEALLAAGVHVDSVDARGRSAFYRASTEAKEDAMRLLLDAHANINLRANDQSTPLIEAVTYAKLNAVQLLVDRGADANLGDANESTPLMIAADSSAYIKNPAEFIKLLLAHGARKDQKDSRGRTALDKATDSKNTAAIEALQ